MSDPPTSTAIGAWSYHWGGVPRPFVHPVTTPSGQPLSIDAPGDHPWHHALWFTIKYVNGENFWEEYDRFGLLVQQSPPAISSLPDGATRAESRIEWRRPAQDPGSDQPVVIREERAMTFAPIRTDAHAMDWDITLHPMEDVLLDRTPFTTWGGYGGLTLRGRPDWHDTALRLADGDPRGRVLGDRSKWCSLQGPLDATSATGVTSTTGASEHRVGILVLDHPENPNHPTPWYASTRADTYGDEGWSNFVNAAFLWDSPIEVPAGERLRLRYRFIAHDGLWSADDIATQWARWAQASGSGRDAAPEPGTVPKPDTVPEQDSPIR